jgi:hypothetical protein
MSRTTQKEVVVSAANILTESELSKVNAGACEASNSWRDAKNAWQTLCGQYGFGAVEFPTVER